MTSRGPRSCLICSARGPGALTRVDLCHDHRALLQGFSGTEEHHVEGRRNSDLTVLLPVSVHNALSSKMSRWPEALRYPSSDPVLRIARRLQVLRDFIDWYLTASERDSAWLIGLGLAEQERHGSEWWKREQLAELDTKGAGK